jgi:hypothetical protein
MYSIAISSGEENLVLFDPVCLTKSLAVNSLCTLYCTIETVSWENPITCNTGKLTSSKHKEKYNSFA